MPPIPRMSPGERLRRVGVGAWSIIGILILAAIAFWALQEIKIIFPPLVLALLIIYLLNPIIGWLRAKGVPRVVGTLGAYVVVLGSITLVVLALIPVVAAQVRLLSNEWPEYRRDFATFIHSRALQIENRFGVEVDTTQVDCLLGTDQAPSAAECDQATRAVREQISSQAGRLTSIGSSVLEALVAFIVGPLIALYLLIDLPNLSRSLLHLVPERNRDEVADLGMKVSRAVGGFFRGQLLVALIVGVLSSIGFMVIGLPFWIVIGAVAGFFNIVPLVGPYIGGGVGFLVGTFTGGITLGLKAALVELVVQQIDNHVISPNVMRRTVNIHPVTVMLALLAGGALAGFWGVLLGVPAVAVGKILLGHLWATRVLGVEPASLAEGARPPPPTPEEPEEKPPPSSDDGPPDKPEEAEPAYPVPDREA
jgi:predicted PurR-regulated permease PerM